MLFTLRSDVSNGNDLPYKFTNYFNENFTIKANSILEVKQVLLYRVPQLVELTENADFEFIFDDATNQPTPPITIPKGKYYMKELSTLLNNLSQDYVQQNFGYSIEFKTIKNDRNEGRYIFQVNKYDKPQVPALFTFVQWINQPHIFNNVQASVGELSKSTNTNDLNDNSWILTKPLNVEAFDRGNPNYPYTSSSINTYSVALAAITISSLGSGFRLGIVKSDWKGVTEIEDTFRKTSCIEVQVDGSWMIHENVGNPINPPPASGPTITPGQTWGNAFGQEIDTDDILKIFVPRYRNIVAWPTIQYQIIKPNGTMFFLKGSQTAAASYRLEDGVQYYLAGSFVTDDTTLDDMEVTLVNTNNEEYTIQHSFDTSNEATISHSTSDKSTLVTASASLSGDDQAGCYNEDLLLVLKGHSMEFCPKNEKESYVGYSQASTADYDPSNLSHALQFTSTGDVNIYERGSLIQSLTTGYSTDETQIFRMYVSDDETVVYEYSNDSGSSWLFGYQSSKHITQRQLRPVVLFNDQTNSAEAIVKLFGHNFQSKVPNAIGQYAEFVPSADLANLMGLVNQCVVEPNPDYPGEYVFDNEPEWRPDENTYHIKLENLPIVSYNGLTHKSERTITVVPKVENWDYTNEASQITFSNFNTQKIALNNEVDFTSNQIKVNITDVNGQAPFGLDPNKDTEIVLEITPRFQ